MGDTKKLAHTQWNCKYHIVFAPKYRRQVFYGEKKRVIGEILRKLCEWKGVNIVEAECCPDHIHMLLGSGLINAKRVRSSYCRHRENAMKELFYLSHEQIARIKRYFPRSHGIPRVDDRRVVSGIIYVIKHGLQWKDAPREYGPYKTLYNRFIRWSRLGVFNRIFAELVEQNGSTTRLMIDATHLKAHRTAASLLKKGAFPDVSDAQKAA